MARNGFLRFSRYLLTLLRITVAVTAALTLLAIPYRLVRDARPQANPTYHLTEIALPGYESTDTTAVSERGTVVGMAWNGSSCTAKFQPFLWRDGTARPLPLPDRFVSAIPWSCNDRGEVVGTAFRDDDTVWGILWKNDGRFTLAMRFKEGATWFHAINRDGTYVGTNYLPGEPPQYRAFRMNGDEFTDLGPFLVFGINSGGDVAGSERDTNGERAIMIQNGTLKPLPTPQGFAGARAIQLNDTDTVVGVAFTASKELRPCLWRTGTPIVLDETTGLAGSVNNRGQVAGALLDPKHGLVAALWQGGKRIELTQLIDPNANWHFYIARDVNDSGQIVGLGGNHTAKAFRGFLLTPDK